MRPKVGTTADARNTDFTPAAPRFRLGAFGYWAPYVDSHAGASSFGSRPGVTAPARTKGRGTLLCAR
jgi:hypothetical protein